MLLGLDWYNPGVWRCNTKIVDVITDPDFDDAERDGNSLAEIFMLKIVQDIEAEVWSRFLAEVPIRFCG